MRVYIGPYRNWIGPYQVAGLLKYLGVSQDFIDWLAEKIPAAPFEWFHSLQHRRIKVRIDNYDTWGMDHTLAVIILPMLIQLKDTKHGSPFVSDDDVPDHLKSTAAPPIENEWDTDDNFHQRWEYVLNEMIYAFRCIAEGVWEDKYHTKGPNGERIFDKEGYKAEANRIDNGTRLFGVYYKGLWD